MADEAPFSRLEELPADEPWLSSWLPGDPPAQARDVLTTAEMKRQFGVTPRALRFYEAKGLLSPQRQGAARLYGPTEREQLALILKAKALGFTLAEIRSMLASPSGDAPALTISRQQCVEQIRLLEQRKREIEAALAELRRTYSSFYARIAHSTG